MSNRILPLVAPVLAWLGGEAWAETLTESEVIRLARAHDPDAAVAREAISIAEAEELGASLAPNPWLEWSREHIPGSGADTQREDTVFLSVPIDVSGRRAASLALARSELAGARALAARAESEAVTLAVLALYDALAAERRVEIMSQAVARLDEAARVLGRRHEEGASSGYERTRLELEAELGRSELRQAEAGARAARQELALLVGLDVATITPSGSLATQAPGGAAEAHISEPRSLSLWRASTSEARRAQGAADRAWIPALSLSGGLRIAEASETRYGYVAGVSISLPVFARGQDVRAQAHARERLAAAHARAAERRAHRDALRAEQELALAREELERFEEATGDRALRLSRAAESGYREGVRSIVELLDTQRARTAVELRRLELALAGKRAEVLLRAARGEFE